VIFTGSSRFCGAALKMVGAFRSDCAEPCVTTSISAAAIVAIVSTIRPGFMPPCVTERLP
jgi:hypothetical protein